MSPENPSQENNNPEAPAAKLKTENEVLHDLFVARPLRLATTCMEKLFKDDRFYFFARYAFVLAPDAKRLFLYGCARQVLKASLALMTYEEFARESPVPVIDDPRRPLIEKAAIEAILDEQNGWIPSEYVVRLLEKAQIRPFVRNSFEKTIAAGNIDDTRVDGNSSSAAGRKIAGSS